MLYYAVKKKMRCYFGFIKLLAEYKLLLYRMFNGVDRIS